MIALLASVTAVTRAVRFVTEKLSLEAEALAYRDALGTFDRAEWLLAANRDPVTATPVDQPTAHANLGEQALREHEPRLRACSAP